MMRYLLFKQLKSNEDSRISQETGNMAAKGTSDITVKSKYYQNCVAKKSKRFRSAFSTEQINYLEREFKTFPYIGSGNRKEVAKKLNIPERAVKIWFQNRRMREKKESVSKEFDMIDLTKDGTKFTNDPLHNSQSNNDHRCTPFEQANRGNINYSVKPFRQVTTVNKEKAYTPNKPTGAGEVHTTNISKPRFAATETTNQVNAVSITLQNAKTKVNRPPAAVTKQNNLSKAPSIDQNQKPASHCQSSKRKLNSDQEKPQDLSSKMNNLHAQQPLHYPVNSMPTGPGFIPLHMQSSYPSGLTCGNVIWKPVNMLSTVPVPHSSIGIPQSSAGVHLLNNHHNTGNNCSCNCHGSLVQYFNQVEARPHPQYMVAIPFINPPK